MVHRSTQKGRRVEKIVCYYINNKEKYTVVFTEMYQLRRPRTAWFTV